ASKEKLPLQVGELVELCTLAVLKSGILERHEQRRYHAPLRVFQSVEQIQRQPSIVGRLAGQTEDPGAERKPVVAIQNLHALQNDIGPLLRTERIAFTLHELRKQRGRAGLDSDEQALVALFRVRRGGMRKNAAVHGQLKFTDHAGLSDDRGHGAVREANVLDSVHGSNGFKQPLKRRNIRCETRAMLVQEQILGDQQCKLSTFRCLRAHIREDLLKGKALPCSQGNRAKLAAAAASARNFHSAVGRAVAQWRNALHSRTVSFHLSWNGLATDCSFKQLDDPFFRFPVEDAIYQPFILQVLLLDLPRTGATDDDLQVRFVLAKQRLKDQAEEFLCIDRYHVRAIEIVIDVGGKGDAQRIVSVYAHNSRVLAQKLIELIGIADRDVFRGESLG